MDNESIVDNNKKLLIELKKFDWSRYISYGVVEIRIRDGKADILAIKQTYQ